MSGRLHRLPARRGRLGWRLGTAVILCLMARTAPTPAAASPPIAIEPLTSVVETPPSGYFFDPYPIRLAPAIRSLAPQLFSGTTKQILACPVPVVAKGCRAIAPITVDPGTLQRQAAASGSKLTVSDNANIYEDDTGAFQMATTFYVSNPAFPQAAGWTVIVHAHPTNPLLPTEWMADTLLVGTFAQPTKADYDGKYFSDAGTLYLIYSARLPGTPAHDGLVAQAMLSATEPAATAPVVLLEPSDVDGGFNSELFDGLNSPSAFKLVETGNITRIDGKYALAYSTGAFDRPDYKVGVAWSDSFLPAPGTFYQKALKPDPTGIWGQPNHLEVQYLLQSQEPAWPNDVADQVLAPGVPSIVQDAAGYHLFFAGYLPSDTGTNPETGLFDASLRRPYEVGLTIAIPAGAKVANTPATDLASWITPVTR